MFLHDPSVGRWSAFRAPVAILQAYTLKDVIPLLSQVEAEAERHTVVGWLAYESAPAFDAALVTHRCDAFPLAWFAVYEREEFVDPPLPIPHSPLEWKLSQSLENYRAAVERIHAYLRSGDTYQVNLSLRLLASAPENPLALFASMFELECPQYAAFIDTQQFSICSASPELFFSLRGNQLNCKPMKGTAARGLRVEQDTLQQESLRNCPKNQAENLMIVDMVRNDMGRIAATGTVQVRSLFDLERYPTLWQMTSTVLCRTEAALVSIFSALFPAASITGAPKVSSTRIIAELENTPRKIYTGALGVIRPGRNAQFSVCIRTALVDKASNTAEYRIGSGIVADSRAEAEFRECQLKSRILKRRPAFELIEAILWEPGDGFFLLEEHLARLAASADYFGWGLDVDSLRRELANFAHEFLPQPHKVRIAVNRSGAWKLARVLIGKSTGKYKLKLAREPVNSADAFLYHKTTRRETYEQALAACPGYDDVLLWNAEGELTESTIANLVVELDGQLFTPPIDCGLLGGAYRAFLLERQKVRERVVRLEDLRLASRIYLINSVRRQWEPVFAGGPFGPGVDLGALSGPRTPAHISSPDS